MPPKGWRKDAQGNYPTTSYVKEQENITIQDLLFPKSIIIKLAKEVGNEFMQQQDANGSNADSNAKAMMINKDAGLAMQRSATVFVNHLLLFARESAKQQERKSCNVEDILAAMESIGFMGLSSIVREQVDEYQSLKSSKKPVKEMKSTDKAEDDMNVDDELETAEKEEDAEQQTKKPKVDETQLLES